MSLLSTPTHQAGLAGNPIFAQQLAQQPALRGRSPKHARRHIFVPYDQLTAHIGPIAEQPPEQTHLVLVESEHWWHARPYHLQKIALVVANMRHFALEQAQQGMQVTYVWTAMPMVQAIAQLVPMFGELVCMEPAERELRLAMGDKLTFTPHTGFLSLSSDLKALGEPPWRHDAFYRGMRRRLGVLMAGKQPLGGKFSYDSENRLPWKGEPQAPPDCTFEPDAITQEACAWVAATYKQHPGRLHAQSLPATAQDAQQLWDWAQRWLRWFGPFEDAMSHKSRGLFHTRVSALLNICRLLPKQLLGDVLQQQDIGLPSMEGFVRQLIGWREFVYQIHRQTDGLRQLPTRNYLQTEQALPPAYWGKASGLNCLDTVVESVWQEGYSHHITRLMVLGNIATLLDVDPEQLNHWFWVAYTDAYDWVVEPNVLGMATYGLGEQMITKPYISGAGYIAKMSDYCQQCAFNARSNCPLTNLYWAFLKRHQGKLAGNARMAIPYASLKKRSAQQQQHDTKVFAWASEQLLAGQVLRPANLPK